MSYNLTIDDSSSILNYLPYCKSSLSIFRVVLTDRYAADGNFSGGWQTWFSVSGFNTAGGEEAVGDSRHITAFPSASVSLQFHGTSSPHLISSFLTRTIHRDRYLSIWECNMSVQHRCRQQPPFTTTDDRGTAVLPIGPHSRNSFRQPHSPANSGDAWDAVL